MRVSLAFASLFLLAAPAAADQAQPQAPMAGSWALPQSPSVAVSDGMTVLAAAIVRGPRGRAVIVGPRTRARTFIYRGRPLAVIRRPRFIFPPGVVYRRWRVGQLLPLALIAAPFFFLEYQALGLLAPPPGYQWVRNGPDLVLVNVRTREVEDVAYDAIEEEDE